MCSFQTISHPHFKRLAEIFQLHLGREKRIPPHFVKRYLNPRALAYWIMDDGGRSCYNKDYERRGFALNTLGAPCFSKEEVLSLCKGLKKRYGLRCWCRGNKGK
jgi:hypothetical protein